MPERDDLSVGYPTVVTLRWWYDLRMTVVIASKCQEGVLLASDTRGRQYIPDVREKESVDGVSKIFPMSDKVAVLSFGAGLQDFDKRLEGHAKSQKANIAAGLIKDQPDLDLFKNTLPHFFNYTYLDQPDDMEDSAGFLLVSKNETYSLHSNSDFAPEKIDADYKVAGVPDILFEGDKKLTARETADRAIKAIEYCAKKYKDDVNNDVQMWLITDSGMSRFT
ncbi:MAG: hypothetical protein Q8Q11_00770 [bacterium]|nr:hypothetical protein [bacterium]MDZ4248285.1 hypothetical protein [Patescibacteria group bacterium]